MCTGGKPRDEMRGPSSEPTCREDIRLPDDTPFIGQSKMCVRVADVEQQDQGFRHGALENAKRWVGKRKG
jgi:hypothetical protein